MKEAVKKAIEGGWKPRGVSDARFRKRLVSGTEFYYEESHMSGFWMLDFEVVYDPLFWQALCKDMETPNDNQYAWEVAWKTYWHRFIDHLAEGKDAESFFSSLANNKE